MAVVPIRFRCYRCNKLLGVAPTKAGAVVPCPNCSAELVVPAPAVASETADIGPTRTLSPPFELNPGVSGLNSGVSLDLLQIRPEDIQVEPGIRPNASTQSETLTTLEGTADASRTSADLPREGSGSATGSGPRSPMMAVENLPPAVLENVAPGNDGGPILPPIQFDEPSRASSTSKRALPSRPTDLVIPRSVVAAWSFLVLLAVAFAFAAGLLAGHFVWRVHATVAPASWIARGT